MPFLWPSGFIHVREMGDKLDKEASNYLFAINDKLRGKGIKGDFFVREGNVAEAICDFAKDNGIDLIAMTSHGRGGVRSGSRRCGGVRSLGSGRRCGRWRGRPSPPTPLPGGEGSRRRRGMRGDKYSCGVWACPHPRPLSQGERGERF